MAQKLDNNLKDKVMELCENIAGSSQIVAACLYGPWVCGYADKTTEVNVLLILERFPFRLNTYFESLDGVQTSVLAVSRADLERDVNRSLWGEFLAEKLTAPYEPLRNKEYLQLQEVKTKKRVVLELIDNLVLEYPELSHEFFVEKEYFMYELAMRRARLFPPSAYSFLNMTQADSSRKNIDAVISGYMKAFEELENEKIIIRSGDYIKISESHLNAVKKRKSRFSPIIKSIQRLAIAPILSVYSENSGLIIQEQRLFNKSNKRNSDERLVSLLEDPRKHVMLPTPLGLIPLSEKLGIEEVAKKIIPGEDFSKIELRRAGGVLNDVYILTLKRKNGKEEKIVVKQFLDWSSIKWVPLALWSFGTTSFSVLGRSRLEKEYAINKFLRSKGFPVPQIFYVSHKNRLIFEEFIEGKELVDAIKRIILFKKLGNDLSAVKETGRKVAEAHLLGVSLGDCKPENVKITEDGKLFFLDLEQATRDGDPAWDIAEFIYYSGHYSSLTASAKAAMLVARSFLEGYLEAGGKKETVSKAASAKYSKVFTVFTSPHVILAISNLCQKMGKAR